MADAGLISLLVLTLNVWGLPDVGFRVLSPFRTERVRAICEELRGGNWDVVFLQEAWVPVDRATLRSCGFPHVVDEDDRRRPLDSGLLILSRYPVQEKARLTFPPAGDPSRATQDGEALALKSAIIARVSHPRMGFIWLANTHLISYYPGVRDIYLESRREQFRLFARWAKEKAGSEPLIVGGDLNFGVSSPLWREIGTELSGFVDPPESATSCTLCPPNTMHETDEGKVDHLFGSSHFTARNGSTAMTSTIPLDGNGEEMSLSDHLGWETEFRLPPRNP